MNPAQPPNPYAPPAANPSVHPTAGVGPIAVWQQEGVAVCAKGGPWPDRCVRCNEPAQGYRLKRALYWHPMWVYVLILTGLLFYVIAALIVRKTATVHVGLCPKHRASRRNWMLIAWLGSLAAIGTCTATVDQNPGMIGFAFIAVFVFALVGILKARIVNPKKIDDTHAWVRCGQPFVESLPPVAGGPVPYG